MHVCQNIEQKRNPRLRRPPSWIFCKNSNTSAADSHKLMKFCSNAVSCYQK